jgi:hypothetical protein
MTLAELKKIQGFGASCQAVAIWVAASVLLSSAPDWAADIPTLLVLPLEMVDTSGETLSRVKEHEDRLAALTQYLSKELEAHRLYAIIDPTPIGTEIEKARATQPLDKCNGPEAAGGRQREPQSSQRDANPAHRASVSASLPWLPARPDRNFTRHVPAIVRTMSAWRYSAISARDESRSVTANCMRHRPQQSRHPRQPELGIKNQPRRSPCERTRPFRPAAANLPCVES